MRRGTISQKKIFILNKGQFLKIKVLLLIFGCILGLAGCTNQENNKVTESQENNKFIGVWSCYGTYGKQFCCITSNGIGYVGNGQSGVNEMHVEEKNTFEYKIEGDTIYLENARVKHSFRLQGDDLISEDGVEYSRAGKAVTIYRESDDGEGEVEFVEIVKGTEKE